MRSFNRLVTERVGALEDRYLATDRPLGEARAPLGDRPGRAEVRELRRRLALDSGYLSRLLRRSRRPGSSACGASGDDRRVRLVELTPAGRAERTLLDRRSDELARSFLEPLDEHRRAGSSRRWPRWSGS